MTEAAEARCTDHAYTAVHQPDLPVYWLRRCVICDYVDPVDLVRELARAGWAPPDPLRPTWSILIATVSHRQDKFLSLLGHLLPQIEQAGHDVEVVACYGVARARPVGEIRQQLLMEARGEWCSFVDDDDWVADDFVDVILRALEHDPDVVGFAHRYQRDGGGPIPAYVSIRLTPLDGPTALYRDFTHIQPVRTGLARLGDFRESWPEDHYWAKVVRPYLDREEYIERELYFYRHSSADSVQHGGVFPDEAPRERPQITSPYFRWIEAPCP